MRGVGAFLAAVGLMVLSGCGGGGGGGSSTGGATITITGNVLWVDTGAGTTPQTTVRIGNVSGQAASADGYFSLDVPAGTETLTATYAPSTGGNPVIFQFNLGNLTDSQDVGQLFIGANTVTVTGVLVDSTTSLPVSGGAVNFAGITGTSTAAGRFTLPGVAYPTGSTSVFLGIQGQATATGYFSQFFAAPSGAVSNSVDVGNVVMVPIGTPSPPNTPYNLVLTVNPLGTSPGATATVASGASVIRTATVDGSGHAYFWVAAGSYTLKAVKGSSSATTSVTLTDPTVINNASVTLP